MAGCVACISIHSCSGAMDTSGTYRERSERSDFSCVSLIIIIRVRLPSQSVSEKHNKIKKPIYLCAPREFLKQMWLPCFFFLSWQNSFCERNAFLRGEVDLLFVFIEMGLDASEKCCVRAGDDHCNRSKFNKETTSVLSCNCKMRNVNRRCPSYLSPLFQSESQCEAFHMEISFIHIYLSTNFCAPREFFNQMCLPCLIVTKSCYFDYRINKPFAA